MNHLFQLGVIALAGCGLAACGASKSPTVPEPTVETVPETPATPDPASESAAAPADPYSEAGNQRKLEPISLAPFTVESLHIGDVSNGHFNLYVKGGEPAVVRAWVGDEAATDVVITKAEFEVDHHCAHLEVPQPLPAEAKLWVEVETADGERLRGSTAL